MAMLECNQFHNLFVILKIKMLEAIRFRAVVPKHCSILHMYSNHVGSGGF
jgi:hypothetical protein